MMVGNNTGGAFKGTSPSRYQGLFNQKTDSTRSKETLYDFLEFLF
jgi:hypothetical protein